MFKTSNPYCWPLGNASLEVVRSGDPDEIPSAEMLLKKTTSK